MPTMMYTQKGTWSGLSADLPQTPLERQLNVEHLEKASVHREGIEIEGVLFVGVARFALILLLHANKMLRVAVETGGTVVPSRL